MSDIKIVGWPKRPAEQRRDELEIENAELRKLVEQMREYLTPTCRGCAFANTSKCDNCRVAGLLEAAEGNGE